MTKRRIHDRRFRNKCPLFGFWAIGPGLLGVAASSAANVSEPLRASLPPNELLHRAKTAMPAASDRAVTERHTVVARLDGVIRKNILTGHKPLRIRIKPARRVTEGYFTSVSVDGSPIRVKLLEVSQLWLRAKDLRLDLPALEQGRVRPLAGRVSARLIITESNVTALLAKQRETAGMNFKAHILKDAIEISGRATSGLVRGAVRLVGVLQPEQQAVVFKINTLTVNGSPVGPLIRMVAQAQINAALRVENIPFGPVFETVRYEKDKVVIST